MKRFSGISKGVYLFLIALGLMALPGTGESNEQASLQQEPVVINIPAEAEVAEMTVHLGDVAVFEGDNKEYVKKLGEIIVGRVPALGKTVLISRDVVVARINQVSLSNEKAFLNMPDNITVGISARKIEAKEIVERVEEFLFKELTSSNLQLQVLKVDVNDGIYIPVNEDVTFSLSLQPGYSGGKAMVKLDIVGNQGYTATYRIPAQVKLEQEIVIALREIAAREIIAGSDVKLAYVDVTSMRRGVFTNVEDVVGKAATTIIKTNMPLTENSVREVPLIARGNAVTILAESGSFKITVPGVAQENGLRNETIRVVNVGSRKQILGKVVDSKTVLVQF